MNTNSPFQPGVGTGYNQTITASGSSQSVILTAGSSVIRVAVSGTLPVFLATGETSATASATTNIALLPGTVECFTVPTTHTAFAIISSGAGSTVYITRGEGV